MKKIVLTSLMMVCLPFLAVAQSVPLSMQLPVLRLL